MANEPLYAWFIRGFFLLVLLLVCHLVMRALGWTIGPAHTAVLLVIAALFIASWVFRLAVLPAFVAWAMMILIVAFYGVLRRFAHIGDLTEPMGWTQRISAVFLLFTFALLLGLLTGRDGIAPGLMMVLFVTGLGCLAYADRRFLIEPLLGPRAARTTVGGSEQGLRSETVLGRCSSDPWCHMVHGACLGHAAATLDT